MKQRSCMLKKKKKSIMTRRCRDLPQTFYTNIFYIYLYEPDKSDVIIIITIPLACCMCSSAEWKKTQLLRSRFSFSLMKCLFCISFPLFRLSINVGKLSQIYGGNLKVYKSFIHETLRTSHHQLHNHLFNTNATAKAGNAPHFLAIERSF